MGYEYLETDSLITLWSALSRFLKSKIQDQVYKDTTYELDRINSELNNR